MAKSWSGFIAQNQEVKEQWGLLEESRKEVELRLNGLKGHRSEEDEEEESVCLERQTVR